MSFIVTGMDMPTCCGHCPMCYDYEEHRYFCAAAYDEDDIKDIFANKRPEYCPLVEMPNED